MCLGTWQNHEMEQSNITVSVTTLHWVMLSKPFASDYVQVGHMLDSPSGPGEAQKEESA